MLQHIGGLPLVKKNPIPFTDHVKAELFLIDKILLSHLSLFVIEHGISGDESSSVVDVEGQMLWEAVTDHRVGAFVRVCGMHVPYDLSLCP